MEEPLPSSFDPTVPDSKERERLKRAKWLPPLSHGALAKQPLVEKRKVVGSHVVSPKKLPKIDLSSLGLRPGAETFPVGNLGKWAKLIW